MVIKHVIGGANILVRSEPFIAASCHISQSASSHLLYRKTHFSIIFHLLPDLPNNFFHVGVQTETWYPFLVSFMHVACTLSL